MCSASLGVASQHRNGSVCLAVVAAHPVIVSVGVLGVLAITLSPYLLVLGFAVALFAGIPYVPGPIRPFVPKPILQVLA